MASLQPKQRTSIRKIFGVHTNTNVPVLVIKNGRLPPKLLGEKGGHFTRGGRRISHPNAYSKIGWSNMVYHRSTLRIYVGELYLEEIFGRK